MKNKPTDASHAHFFKWIESINSNHLRGYEGLYEVWQACELRILAQLRDPRIVEVGKKSILEVVDVERENYNRPYDEIITMYSKAVIQAVTEELSHG